MLFLGLIAIVGLNGKFDWVWKYLTMVFLFIFLNMLFIVYVLRSSSDLFLPILFAVVAGFFISLFSIENKKEEEVVSEHKPGKYVASKMGKTYHAPKCDWAKRIQKKNRVWFDSKDEAKKAKLKAHDCV